MKKFARIARVGWLKYDEHSELKPAASLFHPASLATYPGKPVCITHDDSHVIGTVLSVRADGEFLLATLEITDERALWTAQLRTPNGLECSCSYDYECNADCIQRDIVCRHVALVKHARGGPELTLLGAAC